MTAAISAWLKAWTSKQNIEHQHFDSLTSTNDFAKNEFKMREGSQLALVSASLQTKGRGRGTNQWLSLNSDENLLCSFIFESKKVPQPTFSIRVGLALQKALTKAWPNLNFAIKAPNDIYLDGKKLAGLLIEVVSASHAGQSSRVIVGTGINFFSSPSQTQLNNENLAATATFLAEKID